MRRINISPFVFVILPLLSFLPPAYAEPIATPEISDIKIIDEGGVIGVALVGPEGSHTGAVFSCEKGVFSAVVVFPSFTPEPRPTQLGVKRPDGSIWRYGFPRIAYGGANAGFPRYDVPAPAAYEMFDALIAPGALLSNGYWSIWNRISESEVATARDITKKCGGK